MIIIIRTDRLSSDNRQAFDDWFGNDKVARQSLHLLGYSDREIACAVDDTGITFAFVDTIIPVKLAMQIGEMTSVDFTMRTVYHNISYPVIQSPLGYLKEYIRKLEDKVQGLSTSQFR